MNLLEPELLRAAVTAICPDVETRASSAVLETNECKLWNEVSTCLLSSQVPYELAVAAANAVEHSGILLEPSKFDMQRTSEAIERVLGESFEINGRLRLYRFKKSRSIQLARTCHAIRDGYGALSSLVASFEGDETAREWFLKNAPGIGPKQASMFLRNIGYTYQLAVLDRHVLNYMLAIDLDVPEQTTRRDWYHLCEQSLRGHAEAIGYRVGVVDWAIWIVMRVASSIDRPARKMA